MKLSTLIIGLALLVSALPSWAGGIVMMGGGVADVVDECADYGICQNLETPTSGWDHSETWSALGSPTTVTSNYTETVLRGTQSLYITGTSSSVMAGRYIAITEAATAHAFLRFYVATAPSDDAAFFQIFDSSGNILAYLSWRPGFPRIAANHGTTGVTYGTNLATATAYYLWVDYTAGTGTDGVLTVYISTTSTKPGTAQISITTGISTANAARIGVGFGRSGSGIFDQILTSDSAIGAPPT